MIELTITTSKNCENSEITIEKDDRLQVDICLNVTDHDRAIEYFGDHFGPDVDYPLYGAGSVDTIELTVNDEDDTYKMVKDEVEALIHEGFPNADIVSPVEKIKAGEEISEEESIVNDFKDDDENDPCDDDDGDVIHIAVYLSNEETTSVDRDETDIRVVVNCSRDNIQWHSIQLSFMDNLLDMIPKNCFNAIVSFYVYNNVETPERHIDMMKMVMLNAFTQLNTLLMHEYLTHGGECKIAKMVFNNVNYWRTSSDQHRKKQKDIMHDMLDVFETNKGKSKNSGDVEDYLFSSDFSSNVYRKKKKKKK